MVACQCMGDSELVLLRCSSLDSDCFKLAFFWYRISFFKFLFVLLRLSKKNVCGIRFGIHTYDTIRALYTSDTPHVSVTSNIPAIFFFNSHQAWDMISITLYNHDWHVILVQNLVFYALKKNVCHTCRVYWNEISF